MRRWHRWVALPAGLFLLFIAVTGVLLHLDMIRLGQKPPGHDEAGPAATAPIPSDAELAVMIARLAVAARNETSIKVRVLQVDLSGRDVVLTAGAGGPPGSPQIKLDATTGRRIVEPPPPTDFHFILQDLHAGYFFGWTGRIISVLCGMALIVLAISGLQIWWDLRRRRKKGGFFWK